MSRGPILAIVWAAHNPQLEQLARRMGAQFHCVEIVRLRRRGLLPVRYGLLWLMTWLLLLMRRPTCVVVTNTPAFAPLCVGLYCLATGTPYILDVHGHSMLAQWAWAIPIQRMLARRALTNILDQDLHQRLFEDWGAPITRLERAPDSGRLPSGASALDSDFSVTVINTFAGDEPNDPLLLAASQLPDVRFFMLGDTARAPSGLVQRAPGNVVFTGYLRGERFWERLSLSHAIMTLTTTRYSLVSGGVEAMALRKPAILSRQPALTAYFVKGAVFVDHTADSIAAGVRQAQAHAPQLGREMAELLGEKQARWEAVFREMMQLIGTDPCGETPLPTSGSSSGASISA
jgi:glycosyltransferase involved in cell wall biosynthesis